MRTFTIEIFIHKVYSRQGVFIEQYYEGILLGKEFGKENKLGEATSDTEHEVIDKLTCWIKSTYFLDDEKFRIKVLE